jgi:hypothetical protein
MNERDLPRGYFQRRRPSGKRAWHYVAQCKGETPTRFYAARAPATAAAAAFSGWARADVVLWPTEERGVYRATWFDKFSDTYRETRLTIVEEAVAK